jgi:hypothetical protein
VVAKERQQGYRVALNRYHAKNRAPKPKKKNEPLLNAHGMKFEDMVRTMLNSPPMPKAHRPKRKK